MKNKLYSFCLLFLLLLLCPAYSVQASSVYTNPNNGYLVYMDDEADLLSDAEEAALEEYMEPITEYGNVAFHTTYHSPGSTSSYARQYYHDLFSNTSGTVFIIDMDDRMIYIFSDGKIYKTITNSKADTITDNTYSYATKGNFYLCATNTYSQITKLLNGGKIAQPMKYICNALLAVILALLINFGIVNRVSNMKKATDRELLDNIERYAIFTPPEIEFTHQTKEYHPIDSGGGSGGSGGGGGGGGSSGGGGGHSF